MLDQKSEIGIVFSCDLDGIIEEVFIDEQSILGSTIHGKPFATIVNRGSFAKALNFINEIKQTGSAFDWQLTLSVHDSPRVLNFAGMKWKSGLFIVGAGNSSRIEALVDELMQIGNEQANELRRAIKENTKQSRERVRLETELYDELGKLNNELANLQRELSKKNTELEKLNEEKNRFLGMAAHDLRNPLHAIQMYSEFLLEEASAQLSPEHREFVEIIYSSSQFMLRLVNDLLDVAKIESGKLVLERDSKDLVLLVESNVRVNNLLASRKNVSVKFISEGAIPELPVDSEKIKQVLNNLISNAVKFSKRGSEVGVKIWSTGVEVIVSVSDEGQGIPEHELGKLFQPFQRISVKSADGEDSTGLGLAIVKKIVTSHNGRVWVESEPGKGSTFFISLPIP
ncbi:MAG: HAMP domain-containing sensor histidine kinase [Syntrophaceae bacterium]|nr:HAMP domain-containing sensor histidine kinase [Syntrophaceae bacterium]